MADNTGTNMGAINVSMGLDSTKFKQGLEKTQAEGNAFAGKFSNTLRSGLAGVAAGFTLSAVISELRKNYEAAEEAEKIERQLAQTLKATGYAAGISQNQLIDYASSLQDLTGVNDEVIKSAENILLTFRNVNGEVFEQGTALALDMATTMGTDLNSAIVQVGKALNDPIQGLNALRRVGVSFTAQQKEQVAQLVKSGDALSAQKIILNELSSEFGGAAEAAKTSTMTITTQFDDLREELGRLVGTENGVTRWLASMTKGFKEWAYSLRIAKSEIKELRLTELQDRLKGIYADQNRFNEMYKNAVTNKKAIADRNKAWDNEAKAIKTQIGVLFEQEKAQKAVSKQTQEGLSFNTGKQKAGQSEATKEYQSFLDKYKDATNEFKALQLARQRIEAYDPKTGSLGLQNLASEKEIYAQKLEIYKDYYKNILDIDASHASNKATLLKMAENKLNQDLQNAKIEKAQETEQRYLEVLSRFQDEEISMLNEQQAKELAGGFMGSFQTGYAEKLNIIKWYLAEKEKIVNDANLTAQQKQTAFEQIELLNTQKNAQLQVDIMSQRGHDIANILSSSFDTMLTSYGGFSASMKQLGLNLTRYMLKLALEQAVKEIEIAKMKQAALTILGAVTGKTSKIFSTIGGFFGIGKHHSGGTIPNSATTLPGTKEQLALLKGGETVLSPAESTSYNAQQGQGNTIVYAPVVKAMDSKDVAQWFNENKNQIIGIMSMATRDNTGGFRNVIQAVQ